MIQMTCDFSHLAHLAARRAVLDNFLWAGAGTEIQRNG